MIEVMDLEQNQTCPSMGLVGGRRGKVRENLKIQCYRNTVLSHLMMSWIFGSSIIFPSCFPSYLSSLAPVGIHHSKHNKTCEMRESKLRGGPLSFSSPKSDFLFSLCYTIMKLSLKSVRACRIFEEEEKEEEAWRRAGFMIGENESGQ